MNIENKTEMLLPWYIIHCMYKPFAKLHVATPLTSQSRHGSTDSVSIMWFTAVGEGTNPTLRRLLRGRIKTKYGETDHVREFLKRYSSQDDGSTLDAAMRKRREYVNVHTTHLLIPPFGPLILILTCFLLLFAKIYWHCHSNFIGRAGERKPIPYPLVYNRNEY